MGPENSGAGAILVHQMAQLSFALYEAHQGGVSFDLLAARLDLPVEFIEERVEAARLCLLLQPAELFGPETLRASSASTLH